MDGPIGLWKLVEPAFLLFSSIFPTIFSIFLSDLFFKPTLVAWFFFIFQKFWED